MAEAKDLKDSPLDDIVLNKLIDNDVQNMTVDERHTYYITVCERVGLDPMTRPFEFITLNGKKQLYCLRAGTDQLRRIHGVSINQLSSTRMQDTYVVTANATDRSGRSDAATGAVSLRGLSGDGLANKIMHCETKAKRRVTLSLCGLGMLDEIEVETIPGAVVTKTNGSEAAATPPPPEGYQEAIDTLKKAAATGYQAFSAAWKAMSQECREYQTTYAFDEGTKLREEAEAADKAKKAKPEKVKKVHSETLS
jgi:hypothetical protein